MKFLSLFAGIGGFDLGLERSGMECVGQVENDPYCIRVLEKHWPGVKRWGDISDVTAETLADAFRGNCYGRTNKPKRKTEGRTPVNGTSEDGATSGENSLHPAIELICGGFPCQPWSAAGKRGGTEDDRDLWPEMLRIIKAVRPNWVVGENVRNFVSMQMGLDRSISDLEGLGYAVQPFVVPACAVDAPHRRDRVWIISNIQSNGRRQGKPDERGRGEGTGAWEKYRLRHGGEAVAHRDNPGQPTGKGQGQARDHAGRRGQDVADTDRTGRQQQRGAKSARAELPAAERGGDVPNSQVQAFMRRDGQLRATEQIEGCGTDNGAGTQGDGWRWLPEPNVGRVAHGVSKRVDRLKCLGNAVVPQVVERIGYAILEAEGRQ